MKTNSRILPCCRCVSPVSSVAQSCLTLCDPVDLSLPGSSVHGVPQARTLEWTAISFSRGSVQHRDQTHMSCVSGTGRWVLYRSASQEAPCIQFPFADKSPGREVLRKTVVINATKSSSSRRLPVSRESAHCRFPLQPAPSPGAAEEACLRSGCLQR